MGELTALTQIATVRTIPALPRMCAATSLETDDSSLPLCRETNPSHTNILSLYLSQTHTHLSS